ncbi:hypothetical protein MKZ38_005198 [Zalerion maritima]|uniref:Uncharacterized protein n=1 Tax=Zalerion maritima TaxID=339359 RepID=A0AAD5RYA7_9PEZI|nr:hypothetical protein MKZ38_005198 [Zalerion maritima]
MFLPTTLVLGLGLATTAVSSAIPESTSEFPLANDDTTEPDSTIPPGTIQAYTSSEFCQLRETTPERAWYSSYLKTYVHSLSPPGPFVLRPNEQCFQVSSSSPAAQKSLISSFAIMSPALCPDGSPADLAFYELGNEDCEGGPYISVSGKEIVLVAPKEYCLSRDMFGSVGFWCPELREEEEEEEEEEPGMGKKEMVDLGFEVGLEDVDIGGYEAVEGDDGEDDGDHDGDENPTPKPGDDNGNGNNGGGSILGLVVVIFFIIALSILSCTMAVLRWTQFLAKVSEGNINADFQQGLFGHRDGLIVLE